MRTGHGPGRVFGADAESDRATRKVRCIPSFVCDEVKAVQRGVCDGVRCSKPSREDAFADALRRAVPRLASLNSARTPRTRPKPPLAQPHEASPASGNSKRTNPPPQPTPTAHPTLLPQPTPTPHPSPPPPSASAPSAPAPLPQPSRRPSPRTRAPDAGDPCAGARRARSARRPPRPAKSVIESGQHMRRGWRAMRALTSSSPLAPPVRSSSSSLRTTNPSSS